MKITSVSEAMHCIYYDCVTLFTENEIHYITKKCFELADYEQELFEFLILELENKGIK